MHIYYNTTKRIFWIIMKNNWLINNNFKKMDSIVDLPLWIKYHKKILPIFITFIVLGLLSNILILLSINLNNHNVLPIGVFYIMIVVSVSMCCLSLYYKILYECVINRENDSTVLEIDFPDFIRLIITIASLTIIALGTKILLLQIILITIFWLSLFFSEMRHKKFVFNKN